MKSQSILITAVAVVFCAATKAQLTVPASVEPSKRSSAPLLTHNTLLFHGVQRGPSRVQVVIDASVPGGALVRGLAFRADNPGTSPVPGVTADLTVTAGYSGRGPADMSASMARNRSSAMTVVRSGPIQLPRLEAGVMGMRVHVPFAQAFAFDPAQGNLLLEIESDVPEPGGYAQVATAVFELADQNRIGAPGPVSPGVQSRGITSQIRLDPATGMVQHVHALESLDGSVVVLFGFDGQHAGGMALPLELSAFGAPGQTLLVNPVAMVTGVPVTMQSACVLPVIRSPGASFPTPLTPSFQGTPYISQIVLMEQGANAAGIVLTDATVTTMVAGNPAESQAVWSHPSTDLGRFLAPMATEASSFSAPILELDVQQ